MVAEDDKVAVLFVCMGNICRSPTAEGVFRKLVSDADLMDRIEMDSAGTHAYHTGEPPDRRAQAAAERRGIEMSGLRARRVTRKDFERFDLIIAMDRLNLETLRERATDRPTGQPTDRLRLMLEFSSAEGAADVPDPYYGGAAGFERVLDLVEDAAEGLLREIRERHL